MVEIQEKFKFLAVDYWTITRYGMGRHFSIDIAYGRRYPLQLILA